MTQLAQTRSPYSGWGFVLLMAVMCSLSPFAMSFPVPAFPDLSAQFGKSVADIQFLISVFLIGLGLAQPIHGMLADRFGRRPVLLIGFGIFIASSLAICFITSWEALVGLRFLQAVGVSAGTVTSRAIVNDVQTRDEAAVTLSYISIAMGLGPIMAPVMGGVLTETVGWHSIFAVCAGVGFVVWIMALQKIPESRPQSTGSKPVSVILTDYWTLLTSKAFLGYTFMFGFGQGIFFAFLPFAPDYFENVLGKATAVFVISWIGLSLAFMTGSFLGTRLVRRLGMEKTIRMASIWLLVAAMVLALTYRSLGDGVISATVPLMLMMLATGLICPLALTGSISFDPKLAGTASGLSSSLGLIIGGSFAVVSGKVYDGGLWPFVGLVTFAAIGNIMGMWMTQSGSKRG